VPDQLRLILHSPARLAACAFGALLLVALTVLFLRMPAAIPVALLIVAPVRIPVRLGGDEALLLLPLYLVLAAGALALAVGLARGAELRPLPLLVAVPTAALVALVGLSLLWSVDPHEGSIRLVFFFFPFALLVAVVAQTTLTEALLRALAVVLLVETALVAALGLWQEWRHGPFPTDDLDATNAYASYFRVSGIFKDPSIYGRFLVLGIVLLLVLLWLRRIGPRVGLPLMALLLVGLYFSYSQSSFAALFAGALVVGLLAGDRATRRVLALTTAVVVVLVVVGVAAALVHGDSSNRASSDRLHLVSLTWPVFVDHPVAGVGIGAQNLASSRLEDARGRGNASHTTPLTVAAEVGLIGLAAYAGFLYGAGRASFLTLRRDRALGLALLGFLTVLVVHSFAYSGFFEDPFTWFVLALAGACLAAPRAPPTPRAP
ncbi:MAG TPA: O-antigen ligase family protein, partial [Gaiellaceae bacterium]